VIDLFYSISIQNPIEIDLKGSTYISVYNHSSQLTKALFPPIVAGNHNDLALVFALVLALGPGPGPSPGPDLGLVLI
jgi:hypothetical protein